MVDVVGLCSSCGKPGAMFTCHLCGRHFCMYCIDTTCNICHSCKVGKH